MRYSKVLLAAAAFCSGVFLDRFYLSAQPQTDLVAATTPQKARQSSLSSEYVASHHKSSTCATRDRLPEPGSLTSLSAPSEHLTKLQENYAAVLRELGFSEQEVYESIANFRPPRQVFTDDEPETNATEPEFERSSQELKDEYEQVLLELGLSPGDAAQTAAFSENFSHVGETEEDQLSKAAYEKVLHELGSVDEPSSAAP